MESRMLSSKPAAFQPLEDLDVLVHDVGFGNLINIRISPIYTNVKNVDAVNTFTIGTEPTDDIVIALTSDLNRNFFAMSKPGSAFFTDDEIDTSFHAFFH